MDAVNLRQATPTDLPAVHALLKEAGLPSQDVSAVTLCGFVLAERDAGLVGAAGIERCGDGTALLRSVVVAPAHRRGGLARRMVEALEQRARGDGVSSLYLLTLTAADYFGRLGYRRLERDAAPLAVRATPEFSGLCPASAQLMVKPLICNVLFLCTANSARSILAEVILNHVAAGRQGFRGHSAGSHPRGQVNPDALRLLRARGLPTEDLRSKSWDEFASTGAPRMDYVFTVCDQAAGETCPYFPGAPVSVHWGMPDPAAVPGDQEQRQAAFAHAFAVLQRRIEAFTALPSRPVTAAELAALVRT